MTNSEINRTMKVLYEKTGESYGYRKFVSLLESADIKLEKNGGIVQIAKNEKVPENIRIMAGRIENFTEWKMVVKKSGDKPTLENIKNAMEIKEYFDGYSDFYYDNIKSELNELHDKYKNIPYSELKKLLDEMIEIDRKKRESLFGGVSDEFKNL